MKFLKVCKSVQIHNNYKPMLKWMLLIIIHIEICIMWEVFEGVLSHLHVHTVWMTQAPQIGLKCMIHNGLKEITEIHMNTQLLFIVDIGSNDPPFIIPPWLQGRWIFSWNTCVPINNGKQIVEYFLLLFLIFDSTLSLIWFSLDYIKAHPLSLERYDRFFSWPTSGGVSSTFTHVRPSVRRQLTKLFNIFGSGWDIFLKSFGDITRMFLH